MASALSALLIAAVSPGWSAEPPLTPVKIVQIQGDVRFLPLYGAIANGYFSQQGLNVELTAGWGPESTSAKLLQLGEFDIGLMGPENAVYLANAVSAVKLKMIASIADVDGMFLVSRKPPPASGFRWDMIKGSTVLGWRHSSTPGIFFEHALRMRGIDPKKDLKEYGENVGMPVPGRPRRWEEGIGDFAIFFATDAARLERQGKGHIVASVGEAVGPVVYTVFVATTSYIEKNPSIIQRLANAMQKGLTWIATVSPDRAAAVAAEFVRKNAAREDIASAVKRYREIGYWKRNLTIDPKGIADLQSMMIRNGVMKADERVMYQEIVAPEFAENAKRNLGSR